MAGGGHPVSNCRGGMWLDAENCLLCGLLGRSQKRLRSEGEGSLAVQRRAGAKACSRSDWLQSRLLPAQGNHAWPACPVHPGSGTECRRHGLLSAQRLQPGDLPSHASVLGAVPGAGLEGFPGLPSSAREVWLGTPPQRVRAARLGLGLPGSAAASLHL